MLVTVLYILPLDLVQYLVFRVTEKNFISPDTGLLEMGIPVKLIHLIFLTMKIMKCKVLYPGYDLRLLQYL